MSSTSARPPLAAIALCALCTAAPASAQTLYFDDFSGGSGSYLHNTTPDTTQGSNKWVASIGVTSDTSEPYFAASGDVGGVNSTEGAALRSAWLPFTPAPNKVYVLLADVNAREYGVDGYTELSVGFAEDNDIATGYFGSSVNGYGHLSFEYWDTADPGTSAITIPGVQDNGYEYDSAWYNPDQAYAVKIVLTTTAPSSADWTMEFFVDGTSIRGPVKAASGSYADIRYVGITSSLVGTRGRIDNFTLSDTLGDDSTPPTVTDLSPADDASNAPTFANLEMTFYEAVKKGTGAIEIRRSSDDSLFESIDVGSAKVTVANDLVTIDPSSYLAPSTDYYVRVGPTAIKDLAGNPYEGIVSPDKTTWNFNTQPPGPSIVPPTNPADGATNVASNTDLELTFDTNIQKGAGSITIREAATGALYEIIDVNSARVVAAGAVATIDPVRDFLYNAEYTVDIDGGAFENISGNPHNGLAGWELTITGPSPDVIFVDDFSGGAGTLLDGQAPDVRPNAETWTAQTYQNAITADGSIGPADGFAGAWLPFTIESGNLYVLSADVKKLNSTGGISLGFSASPSLALGYGTFPPPPYFGHVTLDGAGNFVTAPGQDDAGESSPAAANPAGSFNHLEVVLEAKDPDPANWTMRWSVNGAQVRASTPVATATSFGSISYVGFTEAWDSDATGAIDNFKLRVLPAYAWQGGPGNWTDANWTDSVDNNLTPPLNQGMRIDASSDDSDVTVTSDFLSAAKLQVGVTSTATLSVAAGRTLGVTDRLDVGAFGTLDVTGSLETATLNSSGSTTFHPGAGGPVDNLYVAAGNTTLNGLTITGEVEISGGILNLNGQLDFATLEATGGTVNVNADEASVDTLTVEGATLNASQHPIAVNPSGIATFDDLTFEAGPGTGFLLSGADVGNNSATRTLGLIGGTTTVNIEAYVFNQLNYAYYGGASANNLQNIDDGVVNGDNDGLFDLTPTPEGSWPSLVRGKSIWTGQVWQSGNMSDNYCQMWWGHFHPPVSGTYQFYVHGDDYEILWIDTNRNGDYETGSDDISRNASGEEGWNTPHTETVSLTAGEVYPFALTHNEGGGGDFLNVTIRKPGGSAVRIEPGNSSQNEWWSSGMVPGGAAINLPATNVSVEADSTLDLGGAPSAVLGALTIVPRVELTVTADSWDPVADLVSQWDNGELTITTDQPNNTATFSLNLTPYEEWAIADHGLAPEEEHPDANPDHSRLNNRGEFAFNGDPADGSDDGYLTGVTQDVPGDGTEEKALTITFAARAGAVFRGRTIGIDPGPTAPANNFNDAPPNPGNGTLAAGSVKDLDGAVVEGVSVTFSGFSFSAGGSTANGGEPEVFDPATNLIDFAGTEFADPIPAVTFSGLNDANTYNLLVAAGYSPQNFNVTFTADGRTSDVIDTTAGNPTAALNGLSTDGSGNLVIEFPGAAANYVTFFNALALEEVGGSLSGASDEVSYTVHGSHDMESAAGVTEVTPAIVPAGWPPAGGPGAANYEYHTFKLIGSEGLPWRGFLWVEVNSD